MPFVSSIFHQQDSLQMSQPHPQATLEFSNTAEQRHQRSGKNASSSSSSLQKAGEQPNPSNPRALLPDGRKKK